MDERPLPSSSHHLNVNPGGFLFGDFEYYIEKLEFVFIFIPFE